jgi:hypothetical protein
LITLAENLNLELHVEEFSPKIPTWSSMLKTSAENPNLELHVENFSPNLNLELHVENFSPKSQLGAPC